MKRILQIILLFSCITYSQNKQLLYGFEEIPQSLLINPGANVNNDWYVGIPLLSHIHANFGTSSTTVYDVFADDGRDFNQKLRTAINGMKDTDYFAVNQQLEIFSGGFSFGPSFDSNEYISFGMYQETDVFIYFPKDYAILALEGNQSNINRVFDLSDLNLSGELISVLHLGYNKRVSKKLTLGARVKFYSSVLNFSSTKNRGSFVTRNGDNNFYDHVFDLDLALRTSGFIDDNGSDAYNNSSTLAKRLLFSGNDGLGLDVGFTYKMSDQLVFDASLQDIGFLAHTNTIKNYELNGSLIFDGINPVFPETENGQTAEDYWEGVADNFEDLFDVEETRTSYTTWRPIKFNSAIRYVFGKKMEEECNCIKEEGGYLNAIGAQLFAVNRPRQPQLALTAYYYRQLFNQFRFKATYTVDTFSFKNIGVGISANIGKMNFYAMVDNLLEFQNLADTQTVSLQLGFNLIFDKDE